MGCSLASPLEIEKIVPKHLLLGEIFTILHHDHLVLKPSCP